MPNSFLSEIINNNGQFMLLVIENFTELKRERLLGSCEVKSLAVPDVETC